MISFAAVGDPTLLVLSIPRDIAATGEDGSACFALPVASRQGGLTLAVPLTALEADRLVDELTTIGDGLLGPSKSFTADLLVEAEDGSISSSGSTVRFLVVDFTDVVLSYLTEYAAENDDGNIIAFDPDTPHGIPSVDGLVEKVREWAAQEHAGRIHFYSAREEQEGEPPAVKDVPAVKKAAAKKVTNAMMVEQLTDLAAQVRAISAQQLAVQTALEANLPQTPTGATLAPEQGGGFSLAPKMPGISESVLGKTPKHGTPSLAAVHKAAQSVGLPPRLRPPPKQPGPAAGVPTENMVQTGGIEGAADPVMAALSQQSSALTALVAHLASNSDPLGDLSTPGGGSASSSTRGVQRRERLQSELAIGTSNFFMQVQQQMHRRLHPSKPVPRTDADLQASNVSMLQYLERFGGYRNNRETGIVLWQVGHIMDAMAGADYHTAQERLALLACSLEQSALDGNWNLAFVISLMEEPPIQVFQDRMVSLQAHGRPFSALIPSQWAAVALAYLKDLEVLQSKKQETVQKGKPKPGAEEESPSPRRRPRYPKKPKAQQGQGES